MQSLDQQVLALVVFHTAYVDDLVVEGCAMKPFGPINGGIQDFAANMVIIFEPVRHHFGICEDALSLL